MKSTYRLILVVLFFSCRNPLRPGPDYVKSDTIRMATQSPRDTILIHDTVEVQCDSLENVIRDLNTELFINRFKVERVKYYLNICKRRPTQRKFLMSWIDRSIQQ